ncbi:MAG TPA: UDP-N-acetylglucosamine 2-epimerase (non-hydrolyzing), partial [Candidatus Acidoferrum sp.]|nr:UDP-N-acetylglucosamine 2-epimerase (non-hydrolyzing) [Candidatus Acidoferrum sp.]
LPLARSVSLLRNQLREFFQHQRPDIVLVQGDTSTAYAGALAATDCDLPLAHLEAGLRTSTPTSPFPEEMFRRRISLLARWHFAPTAVACSNLLAEGIAAQDIHVVGNSIVDLLKETLETAACAPLDWRSKGSRLIVLTMHRRENYQHGLVNVSQAMIELLQQDPSLCLVCPLHPNPRVRSRLERIFSQHPRVLLTEPLPYRHFISLLREASLIVTDSGGIQEEAPYIGVPVLVTRQETERPECLRNGLVKLAGNDKERLVQECTRLLDSPQPGACRFDDSAPFGAGRSSIGVLDILSASGARNSRVA